MRLFTLLLLFVFTNCTNREVDPIPGSIQGLVPVYATAESYQDIGLQSSKSTVNAGKIYAYGNYVFQVDQYEGVHIIADAQSKSARKIAFLKVPFCSDVAVKANYLYINNLNDLLVFDISSVAAPKLVRRLANAFPHINQQQPDVSNTFFECPDPKKGIVVRWESKTLTNPKCRR